MATPSPLGAPVRRGGRSPRRWALTGLAAVWLIGGLVAAVHYVDAYYQYRGFAPPRDPGGVAQGRVLHETFYSAALGRPASYVVYLPPGYDLPAASRRHYPVLYLLHGSPGYPEAFLKIAGLGVTLDVLVHRRKIAPMLLVIPDGRRGGDTFSDTEWSNGTRGRYGDFALEVVADVDRRLRTKPVRTARVLAGYSEGAYAAVNLGLHNLFTFAGIEAWSGYYFQGRSGTFVNASQATLNANSPLYYATSLAGTIAAHPVRIFLYTGNLDSQAAQMAPLVAELRAAGADARSTIYPGAHDWQLWRGHAAQMLAIAARDFALAPRRGARLSALAARRAQLAALAVAAQARAVARRGAVIHDQQVAGCRASVAAVTRTAPLDIGRLSRRGRSVVHFHLVRICLTAPARPPLNVVLCRRLPSAIAIRHPAVLKQARSIIARCLRAVRSAAPPRAHG